MTKDHWFVTKPDLKDSLYGAILPAKDKKRLSQKLMNENDIHTVSLCISFNPFGQPSIITNKS
jgi:hypothetical protein